MFGITALLFVIMRLAPGDPAAMRFADMGGQGESTSGVDYEAAITKFRERYHLDKPIHEQYGYWLLSLARLDFGYEFSRPAVPVRSELWRRLQITVPLSVVSVLLAYLIALPLGIL